MTEQLTLTELRPDPAHPMVGRGVTERLWSKVDKGAAGGCWRFTGARTDKGYGSFRVAGRSRPPVRVHRFVYELLVGPIPAGMELDHLCRNRACVNPAHLEVVTPYENWRRGNSTSAINARKSHCARGHEFTAENTRRRPSGHRECRACERARYLRRRKAAIVWRLEEAA